MMWYQFKNRWRDNHYSTRREGGDGVLRWRYLSCYINWPAMFGWWQALHDRQVERVGHLLTATCLNAQILENVNFTLYTDLKRIRKIKIRTKWKTESMQVGTQSFITAPYKTMMQCIIKCLIWYGRLLTVLWYYCFCHCVRLADRA